MKKQLTHFTGKISIFIFLFIVSSTYVYSQTYQWANKFGATGEQMGDRCFIDQNSSKIFTAGHFKGTVDFDPGSGTTELTSGTGYNGYVASYSSAGALIWAKSFYSASGESYITGVVTDVSLNVYVSGYFKSQMDVDPGPLETSIATGGQQYDGFIVKLNPSGALVWYKTIGTTSSDDRFRDIVLDSNGNVIVVGHSDAVTLDIDPGTGVTNLTGLGPVSGLYPQGNTFGIVLKLTNAGNYVSNYQKANNSHGSRLTQYFLTRVKVDSSNDIFVTGYRHYDDAFGGQDNFNEAILIKLSEANNTVLRYAYYYAHQNNSTAPLFTNIISDIEIDAAGNYYLVGYFNYNIHVGSLVLNSTNLNINKGWVAKYNSAGAPQWAKAITLANNPTCVDLDNSGNIYIGGYYSGTVDFDPASGVSSNSTAFGGNDGYLLKLNNNGGFTGNIQKLAGLNNELISDLALKKSTGDFVITGSFTSSNVDFNPGASTNPLSSTDLNDAFLAKYSACTMPLPPVNTTLAGDLSICGGGSVALTVADQTGATFSWFANATGGLQTSAGITKTVSPTSTTSYFIQASNSCGTSARTEIIVTAVGSAVTPTLVASSSSPSTVCQGSAVTITTAQTNGGTPTYQWYRNNIVIPGQTGASLTTPNLPVGVNSVKCKMTSNAACRTVDTVSSNAIVITVNSIGNAGVNVTAPQTTICNGASLTFTATPTHGGSNPLYQWKVNNTNQGGNTSNATFTSSNLSNGAQVYCVITSNASCLSNSVAQSNVITVTVSPNLLPTASISTSQTTICTGASVTFTANGTNLGTSPTYQWKLNSVTINGATSSTYTTSALTSGASITCVITSNANCATPTTATSNAIVMNVVSSVTPALAIAATQTTICPGTTINFSSVPTNGGSNPTYQWKLNGSNIGGANAATYSSSSLTNGASITCVMTSNNSCASPLTANSNALAITVTSTVTPSVAISAQQTSICQGDSVHFTAIPVNGGLTPTYQWKKNSVNISGATSSTYSTTTGANGDIYQCVLTSADPCASPSSATSNSVTLTVNSSVTASISIVSSASAICSGSSVTFTATPINGGTTPAYQWKINGNDVGTNTTTYSSNALNNGDIVTCVLSSNVSCLNNQSVLTSNAVQMTVNNTGIPTASIQTTQNTICSTDTLNLRAVGNNLGEGVAAYQWKVNNNNVGTNNDSIALSGLNNGDVISCVLTSSETCVSPSSVTATYTASVLSSIGNTNSVSASSSSICQGSNVIYTSVVSGTASSTSYQWYVNGSEVNGATTNTYSTFPTDNDEVYCIISSISACGSTVLDTSNSITMTVGATGQIAYVYISTPNYSICSTDTIVFTSNTYHTGNNPTYNWLVNGISVGIDSNQFVTGSLSAGDSVQCVLISSDACLTSAVDTSSAIVIGVTQTVYPQMNLTVTDSIICAGQNVTFTNSYSGGGSTPFVQWYLVHNGFSPVGTGAATYSSSTLVNNDTIAAVLVNNDYCATPNFSVAQISVTVGIDTSVTYSNGTYTANMSGATYQWIDCGIGGQPVVGETNQAYTPILNGSYAVIIDIGGCSDTSTCGSFYSTGGLNTEFNNFPLIVYPNPATDLLVIKNKVAGNVAIELVDYTGKIIYATTIMNEKVSLDISNYSNGLYFLKATSHSGSVERQKVIIAH